MSTTERRAGEEVSTGRIAYLSELARIALTREESLRLEQELQTILDYVSQLNAVDTEGVEPTYHVLPMSNVFREDEVEPSLPAEDALANAPDRSGTAFRVPRVI
jgi:aspartyl-tRNA(Asn)/glutamyl-tRNA(Gln) amidotransferase subunit C